MPRNRNVPLYASLQGLSADSSTAAGTIATVAAGGGTVVGSMYCNSFAGQTAFRFLTSSSGDSWRFNIETNTGKPFIWTVNTSSSGTTNPKGDAAVPYRQWFRFAITQEISGGNLIGKIYINGQLVASATETRDVAADNFFKITTVSSYQRSMIGVYERVLTDKEILQDMADPLSVPGAKLKFRLDEGAGTVLYDTASGNNATGGTPTYSNNVPFKSRKEVNQNLAFTSDFSFYPKVNAPLTTTNRYYDGTSGGSTTNRLFGINHSHSGSGSTLIDTSELFNGKPSLKISTLAPASYVEVRLDNPMSYNTLPTDGFPLQPSTQYELTYWMKTNVTSGDSGSGAQVAILTANGAGAAASTYNGTLVKTTTGWAKYTVSFTTSATDRRGHIEPRLYGHTGAATLIMDAWIADIKVLPVTAVARISSGQRKPVIDYKASLLLSSTNHYASIPSTFTSAVNAAQAYTLKTTIKRSRLKYTQSERFMGQSTFDKFWLNIMSAGTQEIRVYHQDLSPASHTTNSYRIQDYLWHDVVVTFANNISKIYVDGVLQSTATMNGSLALYDVFYIAGSSGFEFAGSQSHSAVWTRALTPTEISEMYVTKVCPKQDLFGEYRLDEGAGTTAYDSSGNGTNATITGATYTSDTPSKSRQLVDGNLVKNGDFEYAPPFTAATSTNARWIDGSSGGSTTNDLFGWGENLSGTVEISFDNTEKKVGNYSLKLSTKAVTSWIEVYPFPSTTPTNHKKYGYPVEPSTSYKFSYWMKTNYVSGDATNGAWAILRWADGDGTVVASSSGTAINTTTDWTYYETTVTTSSTARYAFPRIMLYGHQGTGTLIMDAWFDDIQLRRV